MGLLELNIKDNGPSKKELFDEGFWLLTEEVDGELQYIICHKEFFLKANEEYGKICRGVFDSNNCLKTIYGVNHHLFDVLANKFDTHWFAASVYDIYSSRPPKGWEIVGYSYLPPEKVPAAKIQEYYDLISCGQIPDEIPEKVLDENPFIEDIDVLDMDEEDAIILSCVEKLLMDLQTQLPNYFDDNFLKNEKY